MSGRGITDDSEDVRCQFMYLNLLQLVVNPGTLNAPALLVLWDRTKRCDGYYNMSKMREKHELSMGKEAMNRVLSMKTTEDDDQNALITVSYYSAYHEKELASALTWSNWLHYMTVFRAEKLASWIGIGTTAGYAIKTMNEMYQKRVKLAREVAKATKKV